jgi:hypothetical protein
MAALNAVYTGWLMMASKILAKEQENKCEN